MRAWGRGGRKGSYWKRYCHCRRVSGGFGSSSLWTASKIVPESLPNSIAFGQRLCIVRCLPGGGLNPPPTTTYTHLPPSPPPQPLYRPAMAERYGGVEWRGWILGWSEVKDLKVNAVFVATICHHGCPGYRDRTVWHGPDMFLLRVHSRCRLPR